MMIAVSLDTVEETIQAGRELLAGVLDQQPPASPQLRRAAIALRVMLRELEQAAAQQ